MKTTSNTPLIPAFTLEAQLKRRVRSHLSELGFIRNKDGLLSPPTINKSTIRDLHAHQRLAKQRSNQRFIEEGTSEFEASLANGSELDPANIELTLRPVRAKTLEAKLFRMASLTWSVPVSNGFGRRMRYLVWDNYHDKLAGILAIGDPVFNLNVRDQEIGWDVQSRTARLCNILDAYVLGALPPYNMLLAGKAIACMLQTRDIYVNFKSKYGSRPGLISGVNKDARLLAVTTSSSMGRSSVYNRLKLSGETYLRPIGYTKGWGHFHISADLFEDLRNYLGIIGHPYADQYEYGQGPNWRLRTIKAAFKSLGLQQNLLHHGIQRQVFIGYLAANSKTLLREGGGKPDISRLRSVSEVNELARERWFLPRSARNLEYRSWKRTEILKLLQPDILEKGAMKGTY